MHLETHDEQRPLNAPASVMHQHKNHRQKQRVDSNFSSHAFSKGNSKITNPLWAIRRDNSIHTKHSRASALTGLLSLVALLERGCAVVVSSEVIIVLDLVDSDDPVLTGEGLLHGREFGTLIWQAGATDTVGSLACWEEGVVVVVGHLVPARAISIVLDPGLQRIDKYIKLFFMVGVA